MAMQVAPDVLKLDLVATTMVHHLLLLAALLLLGSRLVEAEVLALVLPLGCSVVLLAMTKVVIQDLGLTVAVTVIVVVAMVAVVIAMVAIGVTVVTSLEEVHHGLVAAEAVHPGHNKTTTLTVATRVAMEMADMDKTLAMISKVVMEDTTLAPLLPLGLKLLLPLPQQSRCLPLPHLLDTEVALAKC